jgi:hypothetical protein
MADRLDETGAGYLILTLGRNHGYFTLPNAACAKRTGYQSAERSAHRVRNRLAVNLVNTWGAHLRRR